MESKKKKVKKKITKVVKKVTKSIKKGIENINFNNFKKFKKKIIILTGVFHHLSDKKIKIF